MASTDRTIVNVGLIGCGEVTQVIHIPTLSSMSSSFRITYLCDISSAALQYCAAKLHETVKTTRDPAEICSSPEVDVIMVLSSNEYHADHTILALRHDKHVFVEKPLALTKQDALAIAEAESASKAKVMVGYMRRYATPFEDAMREIGGMDRLLYAKVRDIICPGSTHVDQSGTLPEKFTDDDPKDSIEREERGKDMNEKAHEECGNLLVTPESSRMWNSLCGLGSQDLSVMREALGMPEKVVGSSPVSSFWTVLFRYPTFTVLFESGRDNIPHLDAHLEVYSANKMVRVQYDTPYTEGLPTTMHIVENADGSYKKSTISKTYVDPYASEMQALWAMVAEGAAVKTTVQDAIKDLGLFAMVMVHFYGAEASNSSGNVTW